jgi:hypothetical protein
MGWYESFPEVCKSLFRIKAQCSSGTYIGTGFVVAKFRNPDKLGFILGTAKHVLAALPEYENIHWIIEKIDIVGNVTETFVFKTNIELKGQSAMRFHNELDIACVSMPNMNLNSNDPLRTINPLVFIGPGVKVGWAGFPEFIQKETLRPHPCYFEGVISTVVNRENKLFYLVDGHGGKGVSGGPLWYWNTTNSNYEVLGVCTSYILPQETETLPGLVKFQAINPLLSYLQTSKEIELNIIGPDGSERNL